MIGKDYGLVNKETNEKFNGQYTGTITVKIAPSGTKYAPFGGEGIQSQFGHVWIEFQGESIGWGVGDTKEIGGTENLTFIDSIAYNKSSVTNITYPIYSPMVMDNITQYISEVKSGKFTRQWGDFKLGSYNILTNNCIKFVNSILKITEYDNEIDNIDYIPPLVGLTPNDILLNIEGHKRDYETIESPLLIDITGNGIITQREGGLIYFDHDNNKMKESTGWIGTENNVFLVFDKNKNESIDNGNELFGNNTILKSGSIASNGFVALAELDDNKDNIFDKKDYAWTKLELWKDDNLNGVTDDNELSNLSSSGIQSINLNYQENSYIDLAYNIHAFESSVNWNDGNTTQIVDVYFQVNKVLIAPSLV
ncbi:hypothetical protein [Providencia burhodogranariea]|uniref:Uncharacterized protein n=1 Tax=Providencia burhodogranariea DSM 19968 TaxID=1141662 RepID=K8WVA3_9GAMM|nr:hypothetical protein OOA_03279 [Providencia burhodogranariea DSM 19968]